VPCKLSNKKSFILKLSIKLLETSLRGKDSSDEWLKTLPGVYKGKVLYQGSKSSDSDSIKKTFEKAKSMHEKFKEKVSSKEFKRKNNVECS
jgi:hypothetical protein